MAMGAENVIIREARCDEQSALVSFLTQQFLPRSELAVRYFNKYEHKIDEAEKKIIAEDGKTDFADMVSKHLCCVAIDDKSEKIVGCSLMLVQQNPEFSKTTDDQNHTTYSPDSVPVRSGIYADFLNYVVNPLIHTDIFAEFPKFPAALEMAVFCVDSNYSRRGIGTRLVHETVKYAESEGIKLIYGLFTSSFSRRTAEKNGFQTLSNINLLSLRDGGGNVIYKDSGSHVVSVMAKSLS